MNNDLISRSALKEHKFPIPLVGDYQQGWNDAIDTIIDNAPTVERKPFATVTFDKDELNRIVEERVIEPIKNGELLVKTEERLTGEWIMNKTSARGRNYTCTNCQKVSRNKSEFCPKCGADMRGGRE